MFEQVSPELHHSRDYCRLNYLKDLTARPRNRFAVASNRFAVAGGALRGGNEGGARGKAGPVRGCRLQGPYLFLGPVELAHTRGGTLEELAALEVELDPDAPTHLAPCACGRHTNLSKMGPRARGDTVDKVRSDYIVFGDFVCHSPYVYCMTAYRVPLSKLIKDVTRAKAVEEIEIFEGNLASLREDEMEGLSSADEESDKAVGCNITILP